MIDVQAGCLKPEYMTWLIIRIPCSVYCSAFTFSINTLYSLQGLTLYFHGNKINLLDKNMKNYFKKKAFSFDHS